MVSIHTHLWDTLAVNYMILLLYSYIRPVFAKKNQDKPCRNSGILMWNYLCSIMDLSDPSNRSWIILVAVSCSSINTLVEDLVPLWSAVRGRGLVWSERSKEESVLITCVTVSKYLSVYKTTHNSSSHPNFELWLSSVTSLSIPKLPNISECSAASAKNSEKHWRTFNWWQRYDINPSPWFSMSESDK